MKHGIYTFAALASMICASSGTESTAQNVIPLPPATVTTPGDADPEPDVLIVSDLLSDSEDTPAKSPEIVTIEAEAITEANIDPLADFQERLAAERLRSEQPLEIDTSIDVSNRLLPDLFYLPVVFKPYDIKLESPYGTLTTPTPANPSEFRQEFETQHCHL